jgi:hypothetical protein
MWRGTTADSALCRDLGVQYAPDFSETGYCRRHIR